MSAGKSHRRCFVMMPQSNARLVRDEKKALVALPPGTADIPAVEKVELDFEQVYQAIVEGALREWGRAHEASPIVAERGRDIGESGSILNQVLKRICEADITITDVSTPNPNVLLELGVRLAVRPSLNNILICHRDIELPFDLKQERCIFYTLQYSAVEAARKELVRFLEQAFLEGGSHPAQPAVLASAYELIDVYTNRKQEREPVLPLWDAPALLAEVVGAAAGPSAELKARIVETLKAIGGALQRDHQKDAINHYRMLEQSAGLDRDDLAEVYSALVEIYSANGMKKEAGAYIQKMKELESPSRGGH